MNDKKEKERLVRLVRELCSLPSETTWVEFKQNKYDPEMIGELTSAISNAAALDGRERGYVIWGVTDANHDIVGTIFDPSTQKAKGAQDLESWLVTLLEPRLSIRFQPCEVDGKRLVVLEIPAAHVRPTAFKSTSYIRIGSATKKLRDVPERERQLWIGFTDRPFERQIAKVDLPSADVLQILDFTSFFECLSQPLPQDSGKILEKLAAERLIQQNDAGAWDITNLGAILFARDLRQFDRLARKTIRVIIYNGRGRLRTKREEEVSRGYAAGFEAAITFLHSQLPRNEQIGVALRKEVPVYPDIAVRELIANAFIHQDFLVMGAGPTVEVFDDRIEITNPGKPLGEVNRLLDEPPRSRNEDLAAFMRRIGVCEERGSGVDKIVAETELYQLPPPRWEISGEALRATLFAPLIGRDLAKPERVEACYLHACLRYVSGEPMSNTTLRQRFGLADKDASVASRIIRETLDAGLIVPYDPEQGRRNARYLPFWA